MQDLERQFKSQENGLRIGELIFVDSQKIYAQRQTRNAKGTRKAR
jgi:hypothetical protein